MPTALFVVASLLACPQEHSLQDPGFELATLDAAWERCVFGAPASFQSDAAVRHGGERSLEISASDPSDAALGQEVALEPRGWYRFRGFVRTQQLDPGSAPTCGTFQIQRPHGEGILASGRSHRGDCDWSEVVLPFQTPADGHVRIALFLVGFGRGTGRAWFDDLSLEPFDPGQAPIKVTLESIFPAGQRATISPLQYGQFIEYLCDLVPGMWAERLCDGGFEGLSPYHFEYLRSSDFKERPWLPCGATNRAEFAADKDDKVAGETSQRIRADGATPCTVGVEQHGVFAERGKACTFTCWLKRSGATVVTVRLLREGHELARCEFAPDERWREFSARLVPMATADDATLTIEFRGPATLWIDAASLMPEENVGGWRPDVVAALRALKPSVIRFGGSALEAKSYGDFEWRDVVGPIVKRRTLRAWGGLQPAAAGLEEIVQLIQTVGAEPLICVRITERTPKDAAGEIEYFNGAPDSPQGKLRAANGHAAPYKIRLWQIGNETGGPDYEARLPEFCKAMKAADPSIELLSAAPSDGVVANAGAWLDYVCPHDYGCADLVGKQQEFDSIRALLAARAPGHPIHVAVTEWNTTAGDAGPRRAMLWTLENALACARYHNLMHRNCDLVRIANRSNLTNSFCSGILQTDTHRLHFTPTYWTQWLYANRAGAVPLKLVSDLPTDQLPDLSATLSADSRTMTLFAVNDSCEPQTRTLDLSDLGTPKLTIETLADLEKAGEPDATNSFAKPDRISVARSELAPAGPRFEFTFPALSLTVIEAELGVVRR